MYPALHVALRLTVHGQVRECHAAADSPCDSVYMGVAAAGSAATGSAPLPSVMFGAASGLDRTSVIVYWVKVWGGSLTHSALVGDTVRGVRWANGSGSTGPLRCRSDMYRH
jgi:hypothetical protein